MRQVVIFGLLAILVVSVMIATGTAAKPKSDNSAIGRLRHVVIFKFKDDTSAEAVKSIEAGFAALPGKIDAVVDLEWGTDVSVENLQDGFTHCFLVTFNDAKGRDTYLPHPAHTAFVDKLKPHLDKVLVIDYVAR